MVTNHTLFTSDSAVIHTGSAADLGAGTGKKQTQHTAWTSS